MLFCRIKDEKKSRLKSNIRSLPIKDVTLYLVSSLVKSILMIFERTKDITVV